MNIPLNQTKRKSWPDWHYKSIRLTAEEIENPIKVIDDFFQCYHLPDIRACLQDWLQDALFKETIEVKEHVRTHAQVERLVEAVSLLVGSAVGSVNPGKYANRSLVYARGYEKIGTAKERFKKPESYIEKLKNNPLLVFQDGSNIPFLDILEYLLPMWFRTALMNDECPYSDNNDLREILSEFYDDLVKLVQSVAIIKESRSAGNGKPVNSRKRWKDSIPNIEDDEIAHPEKVIAAFYEKFSIDYVRRELRDFLDAGVGYDGTYPNRFTPWMALMTYEYTVCITEAAWVLHSTLTSESATTA